MQPQDQAINRQVKLSAVVAGVAVVAFIQQLYHLFTANGGNPYALNQATFSFLSVTVLFLTVFYLLLKQSKILQSQLRLAFIDELTGLPNRREFLRLLDTKWQKNKGRHGWAVLYLDLDKFKNINDSYGHDAGDAVIREFGKRISATVRKSDTVARLSGDEFAILLTNIDGQSTVTRIADQILSAMQIPILHRDRSIVVSTSIGACMADSTIANPNLLLSFADFALMQAKGKGRNILEIFNPTMAEEIETRGVLASELRGAIQECDLAVRYQPLYAKGAADPYGVEAFVRWTHSQYGAISPSIFIPIAEEIGLVDDLTWLVLSKACIEIGQLQNMNLSVNISPVHFLQPGFVLGVREILKRSGFPPSRLELEITESVFSTHRERAIKTVEELGTLGIKVAIDDFGTGYSGMGFLRDVPVSRIKIDKSFLTGFEDSMNSKQFITSMIRLGRSLGLQVTVEGVESTEHLDFLSESDCTELQGYHLAKPLSISELLASPEMGRQTSLLSNGNAVRVA